MGVSETEDCTGAHVSRCRFTELGEIRSSIWDERVNDLSSMIAAHVRSESVYFRNSINVKRKTTMGDAEA
ncbi:hypothetical protein BKA82DRAFT_1008940 [Pisolithus tinctorius]|uniref:Uncharacterized protein n=1 Tax=Pisolithus tinctorius Marx 270 TaxID=870435 RepID=A0A0C3NCX1_PISTI|nr:hypothetical protein BKA82DRAFT_1008940 [Pisolithus tinctorius]KIN93423.1 hypothetical protein M404DRAFT_1008940 [Pisolithus tinctorius Marx 270]